MVVREICERIGLGLRCVESMVKYDQRQSIVSKCDTYTFELKRCQLLKDCEVISWIHPCFIYFTGVISDVTKMFVHKKLNQRQKWRRGERIM